MLRRGKPAVEQRLPGRQHSALKGYSLSSDNVLLGDQPAAGTEALQHSQPEQQHAVAKQQRSGARGARDAQHSSGFRFRSADAFSSEDAAQATSPAQGANIAASRQAAARSPSAAEHRRTNCSSDAAARITGTKRKPVGAAQQADIVSGILAQRIAVDSSRTAGAKSGTSIQTT